jgi:hypothetical protein
MSSKDLGKMPSSYLLVRKGCGCKWTWDCLTLHW